MKTYDNGASTHGSAPFWRSFRRLVGRWIDRERELVALRNAVGMMAEARRMDAREYHEMVDALRARRAEIETLESQVSALQARLAHVEAAPAGGVAVSRVCPHDTCPHPRRCPADGCSKAAHGVGVPAYTHADVAAAHAEGYKLGLAQKDRP